MPTKRSPGEEGADVRDGVPLTNLGQPLFDGAAATKRDLVDYLDAVRDHLLPELADRPLSVMRVRPGQAPFMQKNVPKYTPEWVRMVPLWAESSQRQVSYALCNDRRTLLWFANQRAVEYHPTLIRVEAWDRPTHMVLDIDPPAPASGTDAFGPAVRAAHLVRRALAARAERLDPALATTAFIREDRAGKVFIDSTRSIGATVVAAYSPRIRAGTPVSFPVPWDELDRVAPGDFTRRPAARSIAAGATWSDLLPAPQSLPADLVEEGHTIPIARVQAMHEGKRRARARRTEQADPPPG